MDWLKIRAEGKIPTIYIDGDIGFSKNKSGKVVADTAAQVKKSLRDINSIKAKKIDVDIDSLGGSYPHSLSIYETLVRHPAQIHTHYNALSASGATIIGSAGDHVTMSDNALILPHRTTTPTEGDQDEMRMSARMLEKMDKKQAGIFAKKSGKTTASMLKMMAQNRGEGEWITAKEAKEIGLIDEIVGAVKVAAFADMDNLPPIPNTKLVSIMNTKEPKAKKKKESKQTRDNLLMQGLKFLMKKRADDTDANAKAKSQKPPKAKTKNVKVKGRMAKVEKQMAKLASDNKALAKKNLKMQARQTSAGAPGEDGGSGAKVPKGTGDMFDRIASNINNKRPIFS